MTDRADFLRRAGAGAAGLALAQLLGPTDVKALSDELSREMQDEESEESR